MPTMLLPSTSEALIIKLFRIFPSLMRIHFTREDISMNRITPPNTGQGGAILLTTGSHNKQDSYVLTYLHDPHNREIFDYPCKILLARAECTFGPIQSHSSN